jgi:hypothetical protein
MGDPSFAADCRQRAEKGRAAMDSKLFNGEWFIQIPDPENPKNPVPTRRFTSPR